jgi:hypothetical protein
MPASLFQSLAVGVTVSVLSVSLPIVASPSLRASKAERALGEKTLSIGGSPRLSPLAGEGAGAGMLDLCEECLVSALTCGAAVSGDLGEGDCQLSDGTFIEGWSLHVEDPQRILVALESVAFDTFLMLVDQNCLVLGFNDDCAEGDLDRSCFSLDLAPGQYLLVANSLGAGESGSYDLELLCTDSMGGLQKPGDCNQDGARDISDPICLLGHLFQSRPSIVPCQGGTILDPGTISLLDSNGDGAVDLSDAVYDLAFLFSGGPGPVLGTEFVPIAGCPDNT